MPAATLQQITDYDPYIAHLLYSTHSVLVFVYLAHGLPCNSVHMSTGLLHYDVLDGLKFLWTCKPFATLSALHECIH